jgi:glycine cleavage system H protein
MREFRMTSIRYTKEHEYVRIDGDVGVVGITVHAQEQLGDLVFVELPAPGKRFGRSEQIAVVESVKAASEVYAPVSGEVIEINTELHDNPGLVNESAEGEGWFLKLRVENPAELETLMDEAAYAEFLKG